MRFSFLHKIARFQFSIIFVVIAVSLISIQSCQKWIRSENETKISSFGDDESHENNRNCMNCHYTEGRGEGWFTVAGTINGNPGNSVVRVYKDINGAPIAEIEVDVLGNFYTTEPIEVTSGVYYSVVDKNGQEYFMQDKITNGQCNLCHGVTEDPLSF